MTMGFETKLRAAEVAMDTSVWPPVASEAEFWTFLTNDFVHFQDLLLVFQAVFTQWHVHNRALDTDGEAACCLLVSQGEAAVHCHHRLQVQHGGGSQVTAAQNKQSCDFASGQKGQTTAIFKEAAVCFPSSMHSRL